MAKFIAIEEVAIKNMSNWNTEKPPPPVPAAWTSFAPFFPGITLESKKLKCCPKVAKKCQYRWNLNREEIVRMERKKN